MSALELGDVEVQGIGEPTRRADPRRARSRAATRRSRRWCRRCRRRSASTDYEYRRVEVVGPRVSGELAWTGTIATLFTIVGIMIYIWFRFEWQFAIGAVATLVHDAVLTVGFFALTQIDFNLSSIAAILTIIGYSLNDTVVIFDRIRELLRRYKQMPLGDLIDLATNQTLARTIMTSLTTLLALVRALLLRRRGHPLLHRGDALGRVRRDRLVDLHRRPDPHLLQPARQAEAGERQQRSDKPAKPAKA